MNFELGFHDVPLSIKWRLLKWIYFSRWKLYPLVRIFVEFGYSWKEIELAIRVLVYKIAAYNPEVVLGTGVGGGILAAMIAGNAGDKAFAVADRKVDRRSGTRSVHLVPTAEGFCQDQIFKNKRVLVVSAEMYSGQTATAAIELVRKCGASEVKTACFVFNTLSNPHPDYFVYRVSSVYQMPWRITKSPSKKVMVWRAVAA